MSDQTAMTTKHRPVFVEIEAVELLALVLTARRTSTEAAEARFTKTRSESDWRRRVADRANQAVEEWVRTRTGAV